ncbi:glycogen synthase GlgA [Desulfonatronovibrio magnus]|uniref:glycogen synthase GlgA n=1 Tax=Desulfonatronovibrio magnus TaxID=698827 RepID=UPI0005EB45CD|nr:glycogen synthase GlgA [Desulfonatronovibrio magnus]
MDFKPSICFVASEIYPFSKTGGLADVMGVLPLTLHQMGYDVSVITPLYGRIATSEFSPNLVYEDLNVGYPWPDISADIFRASFYGMPVYFIDRGEYFDRRYYYCTYKGDYFDNCERFIFFCRAAMALMKKMGTAPDIVHSHDWHAALMNSYIYYQKRVDSFWADTSTVFTIHNLAFQGRFSVRLFWDCGLPYEAWNPDGVEYYDSFNLLKGGIAHADVVTTVSPSYAGEIVTAEFGCGLEGILQQKSDNLVGILNGADYNVWNPAQDKFLEANYSAENPEGKKVCKADLIASLCLPERLVERPVLGFIGRLRSQKGIDLLLDIIPDLVRKDVGLVVLGEGDAEYEAQLVNLVELYPDHVSGIVGYTEEMAHKIQAGADIFLMPSRYEPCGLTQMYSLRFGTPPIATAVGGLKDTITPYPNKDANGFIFNEPTSSGLLESIEEALEVFNNPIEWEELKLRGMRTDFSWVNSAKIYIETYRKMKEPVVKGIVSAVTK